MVTCTCMFYGGSGGWRRGVEFSLPCRVCVCARRLDGVDGDGLGAVSLWDADSGERCR